MTTYWGEAVYDGEAGSLLLGDADALTLGRAYGTPLVVLNEAVIRRQCRRYGEAVARAGFEDALVVYAGKALCTLAICQLVAEEGLGLDVVSGGELYTALAAGFPVERILFHGNNKSPQELREALQAGVGRIVVDNEAELERLAALAAGRDRPVDVLLRVIPGVEAHTHAYIETGKQDSKFGFDIGTGQALEAVRRALAAPGLRLRGLHCHIGSQILSLEPYRRTVERMYDFVDAVREAVGYVPEELDLGGGLGVRYTLEDDPPSVEAWVETLASAVRRAAAQRGLPLPRLLLEPGRSVIGEAGATIYTVGAVKRVPGLRTYVAVDGGMMENPRPALYGARYTALLLTPPGSVPAGQRPKETVAVVGRACESGDILVPEVVLPRPEVGDVIVLLTTGAYTYSMAGHYNKFPRPAVVLVGEGKARVVVERERYADLMHLERPLRAEPRVASTPTRVGRLGRGEDDSPAAG